MAIAVRSVKAGMTSFGHLRSRLKNGAKLGCRGAAIGPPTRTPAQGLCDIGCFRRPKPYTALCRFQCLRRTKPFRLET
ncbi:hypothetical protein EYY89_19635 [Hafnia paralvei]|uniref:Uncharacterized protein n=1 Tax=Hafnia paralvei TaxID=546367 RepID=A0A4Q9EHZ4_9GAMM|nr:hypothetical protein EYY89_19635 [Hafnia paralvei]